MEILLGAMKKKVNQNRVIGIESSTEWRLTFLERP
jgi:hypothetical protein